MPGSCARPSRGHAPAAAAPPKSVMNSRRRMRPPSDSGRGIVRLTLTPGKGKNPLCALLVDKGPRSQLGHSLQIRSVPKIALFPECPESGRKAIPLAVAKVLLLLMELP